MRTLRSFLEEECEIKKKRREWAKKHAEQEREGLRRHQKRQDARAARKSEKVDEAKREDKYHLAAHYTNGTKKYEATAATAHHTHRALESLRSYSRDRPGEDYNVSVTNRHSGEVHGVQIRRGEYKHGKPVIEDAVPANAMGSSSSVAGSGAVDTFDPVLGARRARKRRAR